MQRKTEYFFNCPKCQAQQMAECELSEHIVNILDNCENCDYQFTEEEKMKIYMDAEADGFSSMVDWAHDIYQDR